MKMYTDVTISMQSASCSGFESPGPEDGRQTGVVKY